MAELDRLVCRFSTLDDFHLRMYGLEDEYIDSSLNVLPDHQYEQAGDRSYTRASEMTIEDVTERAGIWEGDRLSLVYDFGAPSHYYCIVKEVYEPDEFDDGFDDDDVITSTDTAAIINEKFIAVCLLVCPLKQRSVSVGPGAIFADAVVSLPVWNRIRRVVEQERAVVEFNPHSVCERTHQTRFNLLGSLDRETGHT